jgi:hypothetical protein
VTNIIDMIKKCKHLKEEIKKKPRPVVDQNGIPVHKAVKSELNRGFMATTKPLA